MSHVTHLNESCHTFEWVMSHIWMSHSTRSKSSDITHALYEHAHACLCVGVYVCVHLWVGGWLAGWLGWWVCAAGVLWIRYTLQHTSTHCNTLQHTLQNNTTQVFSELDMVFTIIFAVELGINLMAHWYVYVCVCLYVCMCARACVCYHHLCSGTWHQSTGALVC